MSTVGDVLLSSSNGSLTDDCKSNENGYKLNFVDGVW